MILKINLECYPVLGDLHTSTHIYRRIKKSLL